MAEAVDIAGAADLPLRPATGGSALVSRMP